jgi:hypothetical protein
MLRLIVENGTYNERPELLALIDTLIDQALNPPPPPRDLGGEARLISAQFRQKEHADEMYQWGEELKRKDLELMLKAKEANAKQQTEAVKVALDRQQQQAQAPEPDKEGDKVVEALSSVASRIEQIEKRQQERTKAIVDYLEKKGSPAAEVAKRLS